MGIFRFALASGDAKLALTGASIACAAEMAPTNESRRCSWGKDWRATGKTQILESWREMPLPDEGERFFSWQSQFWATCEGWICLIRTIAPLTAPSCCFCGQTKLHV